MPAKQEERIALTSARDLHACFAQIGASLQEPETEDSWQRLDRALARLEVVTKSGGYKYEDFVALFKGIANPIISSLLSERTKLSGTAADVVNSVAPRLAERFESLVPIIVPTLLQICARTNKVALARAKKCLLLIAKHCRLPSLLPLLREGARDKAQTLRIVAVECSLLLLESQESKERIGKRVADVETIIRGAATDSNPEVRQWSKKVFELYVARWPERVEQLTAAFTPTIRRYLSLPKTGPYKPPASFFSLDAGKEEAVTVMEPRARPAEVASSRVTVNPAKVRHAPPSSSHDEPVANRSSRAMAELQPSSSSSRSATRAPLSSSASSTASRPLAATAHVKTSFSVASGLNVASLTTAFSMPHARANSHTAPPDSMRSAVASVPGQRERPRMVQKKSSSSSSDPRICEDQAHGGEHARMTVADEEKQRRKRERREAAAAAAAAVAAAAAAAAAMATEARDTAEEEPRESRPRHPSDSVAARLAKEQAEMRQRWAQHTSSTTPMPGSSRAEGLLPHPSLSPTVTFSVATAKKSAHKKAARVLIAGPPPSSSAPHTVRRPEPALQQQQQQQQQVDDEDLENRPIPMLKFDNVDMPMPAPAKKPDQQADVFGTRPAAASIASRKPLATLTKRRVSSTAKKMGARQRLLGPSAKIVAGKRAAPLAALREKATVAKKREAVAGSTSSAGPAATSESAEARQVQTQSSSATQTSHAAAAAASKAIAKPPASKPTAALSKRPMVEKKAPISTATAQTTSAATRPVSRTVPSSSASSSSSAASAHVTRKPPAGTAASTTTAAPVKKVAPSSATTTRGPAPPLKAAPAPRAAFSTAAPRAATATSGPSKAITARMRPPLSNTVKPAPRPGPPSSATGTASATAGVARKVSAGTTSSRLMQGTASSNARAKAPAPAATAMRKVAKSDVSQPVGGASASASASASGPEAKGAEAPVAAVEVKESKRAEEEVLESEEIKDAVDVSVDQDGEQDEQEERTKSSEVKTDERILSEPTVQQETKAELDVQLPETDKESRSSATVENAEEASVGTDEEQHDTVKDVHKEVAEIHEEEASSLGDERHSEEQESTPVSERLTEPAEDPVGPRPSDAVSHSTAAVTAAPSAEEEEEKEKQNASSENGASNGPEGEVDEEEDESMVMVGSSSDPPVQISDSPSEGATQEEENVAEEGEEAEAETYVEEEIVEQDQNDGVDSAKDEGAEPFDRPAVEETAAGGRDEEPSEDEEGTESPLSVHSSPALATALLVEAEQEQGALAPPSPQKTTRSPLGAVDANVSSNVISPAKSITSEIPLALFSKRQPLPFTQDEGEETEEEADVEGAEEEEEAIGDDSVQLVRSPVRPKAPIEVPEEAATAMENSSKARTRTRTIDDSQAPIRMTRSRAASNRA